MPVTTELGGFVEESTEQKLSDLGRCLYGQDFNDGENTMKGEGDSFKEGVDGVGVLIVIDCIAWWTEIGELGTLLSFCLLGNDFSSSLNVSLLKLIALEVVAVNIAWGDPTDGLPSAETIVWAPRFLPLLDTEERGVGV